MVFDGITTAPQPAHLSRTRRRMTSFVFVLILRRFVISLASSATKKKKNKKYKLQSLKVMN